MATSGNFRFINKSLKKKSNKNQDCAIRKMMQIFFKQKLEKMLYSNRTKKIMRTNKTILEKNTLLLSILGTLEKIEDWRI